MLTHRVGVSSPQGLGALPYGANNHKYLRPSEEGMESGDEGPRNGLRGGDSRRSSGSDVGQATHLGSDSYWRCRGDSHLSSDCAGVVNVCRGSQKQFMTRKQRPSLAICRQAGKQRSKPKISPAVCVAKDTWLYTATSLIMETHFIGMLYSARLATGVVTAHTRSTSCLSRAEENTDSVSSTTRRSAISPIPSPSDGSRSKSDGGRYSHEYCLPSEVSLWERKSLGAGLKHATDPQWH
jgi:hypothetical protein